jgi:hypothetical protein
LFGEERLAMVGENLELERLYPLKPDAGDSFRPGTCADGRQAAARIIEVACNAHARRKFYEARGSDALRSHQALAYYRQLYELERQAKDFSDEQHLQMRQELSLPILEQFHQWLLAQRPEVLPKSPMGETIAYALNNWEALRRYTEAGYLAIDNNVAEREMKRIAIGRKNWLTVGSPRGGQTAAVLFSFTSTCQRLGVEPWRYLRDVLERLPSHPVERLAELLPDEWARARRGRGIPVGEAYRGCAAPIRLNPLDVSSITSGLAIASRWLVVLKGWTPGHSLPGKATLAATPPRGPVAGRADRRAS